MERIAQFEKVGFLQFQSDFQKLFNSYENVKEIYDRLMLPERRTKGSAGYDFYCPLKIRLAAGNSVKIPTGIRVKMAEGWVLNCYPRSSLGFKFRLQLDNTVGIIDSDYYGSDNQGHIIIKLTNDSKENQTAVIEEGQGFAQGIFTPFGITYDDHCEAPRTGGFGSTEWYKFISSKDE